MKKKEASNAKGPEGHPKGGNVKFIFRDKERGEPSPAAREVERAAQVILDEVVAPACGIKPGIWADIYHCDIGFFLSEKKKDRLRQLREIVSGISERLGGQEYALAGMVREPLALLALAALAGLRYDLHGRDGEKKEFGPEAAWRALAAGDGMLRPAQTVRARVASASAEAVRLRSEGREIVVLASDVPSGASLARYAKPGEWLDVTVLRSERGTTAGYPGPGDRS